MLLKDKVAIVTGGASGIGRGIVVKFAAEGCAVVVSDIADPEGRRTAAEVKRSGGDSIFVRCDVTSRRQVQEMVNRTIEKYGRVDILVNNAGGVPGAGSGSIADVTEEQWDRIVDLNLKGQFLCCQAVVPHMKERKYGKIINVSSMGAVHPPAPIVHYHAAKGGVLSLTSNLAFELALFNINVNAILPGPIRTDFYTGILENVPDKEAFFRDLAKKVPLQRMGKPEDIAGVALFLASELSSYVTGESIRVGGGLPLPPG